MHGPAGRRRVADRGQLRRSGAGAKLTLNPWKLKPWNLHRSPQSLHWIVEQILNWKDRGKVIRISPHSTVTVHKRAFLVHIVCVSPPACRGPDAPGLLLKEPMPAIINRTPPGWNFSSPLESRTFKMFTLAVSCLGKQNVNTYLSYRLQNN